MWSLFGLRKDSKKSTPDKEVDGGFVIVAETVEEKRQRMQTKNVTQPSTNVIVQSSKSSCSTPHPCDTKLPAASHSVEPVMEPPAVEAPSTLPDLLMDVPFTLAPHVLAMQAGFPLIPDVLLSRDINYNLASFQYDFTLENSILHSA